MSAPLPPDAHAALHEVRRDWKDGRSLGRVFCTSEGSLTVRLSPAGARLHRVVGPQVPDLTIEWANVATLAGAFARWTAVRDAWAAYYVRGLPPSPYAAHVYWPPGSASERRTVGIAERRGPPHRGVRLEGVDVLRRLTPTSPLAAGIVVVAEFWRTEPGIGPPQGERVGERWLVDGHLALDLLRIEARSHHGEARFPWLPHESEVPAQLLALRPTIEA